MKTSSPQFFYALDLDGNGSIDEAIVVHDRSKALMDNVYDVPKLLKNFDRNHAN